LGDDFETYRIPLPTDVTESLAEGHPIVTLETQTWRPSSWIPEDTDIRDLGVKVDWIEAH
jgi:hypothetical protein